MVSFGEKLISVGALITLSKEFAYLLEFLVRSTDIKLVL